MLQVVLVVMSFHPVRLPGLRWDCSRPGHRLPKRARRPRLHIRAVPCLRHCRPFHVQARGEPGWRGQHPAQGLGVVPAEGNQGAFKVAPTALLRQPDLALAAAGSLAAATAHLAPRARTLGAPPPPPAAAICGASGEVATVSGEAVVFAGRRGEGGSERREGVLCGAPRPPPPRLEDAQTGRSGRGARGGRPGVPTSASGHRAGRGGVRVVVVHPLCGAAQARGDRDALSASRSGVGVFGALVPLPGRPALTLRSYSERSASGLGRSASDKARGALRPQRRLRTESWRPRRARRGPGLHPAGPPFMFVMVSWPPPGPRELGGGRGKEAQRCWVTGGESRSPPAAEALKAPNSGPGSALLGSQRNLESPREGCCGNSHQALREKGGVRNEGRLEGGTRPFAQAPVSPAGTTAKEGRRGGGRDGAGSLR